MTSLDIKQKTIAKEVSLSGVGLHTGKSVTMTFKPAPENYGYSFIRVDLEGKPLIEEQILKNTVLLLTLQSTY